MFWLEQLECPHQRVSHLSVTLKDRGAAPWEVVNCMRCLMEQLL